MASSFSFGFSSDDIDQDDRQDIDMFDAADGTSKQQHGLVPAKLLTLNEMLDTLPSSISYNLHRISENPSTFLPRRELFDIRAQLLAEADVSDAASSVITDGLTSDDITPGLYEGGFKTWECSVDLAKLLFRAETNLREWGSVIEIGAGTALPSCTILQQLTTRSLTDSVNNSNEPTMKLILADYNEHVLTHASIPNLLLTWAHTLDRIPRNDDEQLELEIDSELLADFKEWLKHANIEIHGIAGAWSPDFNQLIDSVAAQGKRLVLASETIYQPESLQAFTETLISLLHFDPESQAFIAAKKIYFGVGGGVDEFLSYLGNSNGHAETVWDSGSSGVGRLILKVEASHQ